jgi:hypothetical protein
MTRRSHARRPRRLPEGLCVDAFGDRILLSRKPGTREMPTAGRELCEIGNADLGGICPLCTRALASVPDGPVGQAYPARFAAPDLPGNRNAGDVLFRTTANGHFAMVVSSSPRSGLDCVLERAKVTGHFTATFAMRSGIWKVALLKSAYLAACLHLGEVPRTQDADHVREIIRSGSFGLGGDSVGVQEPFPFRVFRIYGASTTTARRLWVGVAWIPWKGGDVPIFGVGLGSVAFVTWPIPDQRQ